ncbi:MAG: transporter substrate-binding domain-containing protein [Oscillospiraceae bacterium]|nr:transporter substrate-binding domain-containing protein [Oscillospiraceae bacterium]
MKKLIALLMTLVLAVSCFAACASSNGAADTTAAADDTTAATDDTTAAAATDLSYIQDNGKLIVGITDYAPMDYKDDNGEWTGFDAEFAQLFAKELGVECEFFVIADWGKKFVELETKNIDAVWNGMTITDEAKLNASVSNPYVVNAQVLVMKADKIASYKDAASIADLAVAVENGSAGQDAAEAAGVKNIIAVQDQAAALLEVKAGTSDACVIDITMANAMTGEGTDYADLAAGFSLTSEEYGVAFRKDSDLTAKFNDFMAKLIADGTLQALADKYELTLAK